MNKKTSYIIIFSLLVVLTVGIIFTDYVKQLGTILADASVPNPGHSLSEIEGGQDLATKEYVDSAIITGITGSPTNLGYIAAATTGTITSSTGTSATIPAATTTLAGLMTNTDKTKLNGIAAGAQVNVPTNLGITAGTTAGPIVTSSTGTGATLPTASATASGVVTTGDQTWAGIKTFKNTIVGTGIIASASGGIRPACNASTRGLMWNEYGSSGQDDTLYICRKFSNDTYAYTAVTADRDCGDNFIDPRDSNIYPTVQIGTQCWMKKNLAYLPSVVGPGTGSATTPYYYVYDYTGTDVSAAKATSNYTTYGVLYNWPAANTACPTGWHLPTDAEFNILEKYVVSYINSPNLQFPCSTSETGHGRCADNNGAYSGTYGAGKSLKKVGIGYGAGVGDDLVGFSALLAGYYVNTSGGSFNHLGEGTGFWTSTPYPPYVAAVDRYLYTSFSTVSREGIHLANGNSVRCLRD